jgi:hypothetical protein
MTEHRAALSREGLEPPVNRVLPVSRGLLGYLWKAFGSD